MLYSVIEFTASLINLVINACKYAFNLNYELVAAAVESIIKVVSAIALIYNKLKVLFSNILNHIFEIFLFFSSIINSFWNITLQILQLTQVCYSSLHTFCLSCGNGFVHAFNYTVNTALPNVNSSIMAISTTVTTIFNLISLLGSVCVNFVTGVWHGLGFVLSSVAYFPLYCMQRIEDLAEDSWRNITQTLSILLTSVTKETYLGIGVVCILYLFISNILRYMYCKGLSLFPCRTRGSHATGQGTNNFDFDRGFESDFEDVYGSDTDTWDNNRTENDSGNSNDEGNDNDSSSGDESANETNSSVFSDNDSDEYTVVTEESDSDTSINSQTFSTESSDHEIEVQLPPVDERYSLRDRSFTPSRTPKVLNNQEEFIREMEKERDKRKCVVCQDEIKSVLVLPCRHMCMCVVCANQIVRSQLVGRRVCPLCRSKITKVMNIYV
ncbi:uncharacterized protein LOC131957828 [Physella acuta]|uniref:uncharacterized protein LOC131957828 n=1 Tax=Physella acuta TaxID=109671 RepID=UPI0027DE84AE|nr:uncharacterized protein LOC131957828 [Physella acuta]XP_059178613.1 uncharacterized protein LOC131957828 [Physella acuta]XP_059178614.1 uncharacterized protein LOC131957828 [Physella acuta]